MTEALRNRDADVKDPGSFSDFCAANGIVDPTEGIRMHSEAMQRLRVELAARAGISLEDLHTQRTTTVHPLES